MIIRTEIEGDAIVLSLLGELDLASTPAFQRELHAAESGTARRIVIDLSGLQFIDSAGLQAVLRANERARDNRHRLVLRRGTPAVQRVFELTKTEHLFTFAE